MGKYLARLVFVGFGALAVLVCGFVGTDVEVISERLSINYRPDAPWWDKVSNLTFILHLVVLAVSLLIAHRAWRSADWNRPALGGMP